MKLAKRITAIVIAMALVMALCALPALADTDTKTLSTNDHFDVKKSTITTFTVKTDIQVSGSGRYGFVIFKTSDIDVTDGNTADYVANAAAITLTMRQNYLTTDFTSTIYGISDNKESYSSTESASFNATLYGAGDKIGQVEGTNKVDVSIDVTDYVKKQTDGTLVFKVVGDTTSQYKYRNFTLTFDYSDEAKANSAANKIEVNETYKEDFTLPLTGSFDSIISWTSDNEDVISIDSATGEATVTRPQGEDASVKLTATVTIGETSVTKEFTVAVPAVFTGDVLTAVSEADILVQNGKYLDNNYNGKRLRLQGSGRQNFIRFSQTDMPQSEILNAKLYMYLAETDKTAGIYFDLYGLSGEDKTSWDETITSTIAQNKGLLNYTLESYGAGEKIGTTNINDTQIGQWICVDITEYAKAQTDGIYAFRFYGGSTDTYFNDREVEGFEPYIELSRGDTGAVRSDAESITIPEKLYGSYSALPTEGANGSTISWASDNEAITISGETMTAAAVSENTEAVLTATVTKNGAETTRTFSVTALKSIFTFKTVGAETETLPETGTVSVGIEDGTYIPGGASLFVALYDANGKLDYVRTFKNPAVIDLTADNASRISAYLWDSALTPIYTKTITK